MAIERQDLVTIGSNIAKYRKLKNYTQKELGDILDVNYKTISKWENGNVAPDITLLKSLADVLGISVEELLSGIKVKHKKNNLFLTFNFIFGFVILSLLIIIGYQNYAKYDFYEFKSNHDLFNIEGYVVSGRGKSKYVIEDISYVNKIRDVVMVNKVTIEMYCGEEMIYNDENIYEKLVDYDFALSKINVIFFKIDNAFCDNLRLNLSYEDERGKLDETYIDLFEVSK